MSLLKSGDFIADVERQFEWYVVNAGWDVAERYLRASTNADAFLLDENHRGRAEICGGTGNRGGRGAEKGNGRKAREFAEKGSELYAKA